MKPAAGSKVKINMQMRYFQTMQMRNKIKRISHEGWVEAHSNRQR
jgi:hypothetical protein